MVACERSMSVPVVVAVSVNSTSVAACAPELMRLMSVPVVEPPVSADVELMLSIEPPSAMTAVVCVNETSKPVVSAFATIDRPVPVVIAASGT